MLSVSYIVEDLSWDWIGFIYLYFLVWYEFGVTWIVQDIRRKFGKFNFFIKFVILSFLHQWSLHRAYRIEDSRDGKHISFRGSLLFNCLTIYMHHLRGSVSLLLLVIINTASLKFLLSWVHFSQAFWCSSWRVIQDIGKIGLEVLIYDVG